jgi:hypothetical protein
VPVASWLKNWVIFRQGDAGSLEKGAVFRASS